MSRRRDDTLRRVYREHVGAVYAFFCFSAAGRAAAEDLTSAVFERVIRNWGSYDPRRGAERTWILAIARNQLTDHFRRQRLRDAVSLDDSPALLERFAAPDDLESWLTADEVRSWLTSLPERERQVIALRYGADLPAREIGRLLDLSESNVHQIVSRTLRRLRRDVTP